MPYLSALEVCLRQGAIQIHVYLDLLKLGNKSIIIVTTTTTLVVEILTYFTSGQKR